jgi:hypothetical protein
MDDRRTMPRSADETKRAEPRPKNARAADRAVERFDAMGVRPPSPRQKICFARFACCCVVRPSTPATNQRTDYAYLVSLRHDNQPRNFAG